MPPAQSVIISLLIMNTATHLLLTSSISRILSCQLHLFDASSEPIKIYSSTTLSILIEYADVKTFLLFFMFGVLKCFYVKNVNYCIWQAQLTWEILSEQSRALSLSYCRGSVLAGWHPERSLRVFSHDCHTPPILSSLQKTWRLDFTSSRHCIHWNL